MKAGELATREGIVRWLDDHKSTHVKVGVTDIDGILPGKHLRPVDGDPHGTLRNQHRGWMVDDSQNADFAILSTFDAAG